MVHSERKASFSALGSGGALVALIAGAALIAGILTGAEKGLQSYMFAYICFASMVLGCFGLTLLHHTVRGSWGLSVLRMFEAGGGPTAIAALGLGFIPIAFNMDTFYHHWTHVEEPWKHSFKAWWLSTDTFIVRNVIYFAIWFILAYALRQSSLKQDQTGLEKERIFRTNLSAFGLAMFMLTTTFAITDWVMSMDPHWFSSIFGVWFVISSALLALGFVTWQVCRNRDAYPYNSVISPQLLKDLGNLCFAFTMLWAYMTLSQWIIIWSGNLPEFISYYVLRNMGTDQFAIAGRPWLLVAGAASILFGFFVPWFALLSPKVKARPHLLMRVALLIICVRLLDMLYNIMPFMRTSVHWVDAVALVFFAGLWCAIFGKQTEKASLYVENDQRLMEASSH